MDLEFIELECRDDVSKLMEMFGMPIHQAYELY